MGLHWEEEGRTKMTDDHDQTYQYGIYGSSCLVRQFQSVVHSTVHRILNCRAVDSWVAQPWYVERSSARATIGV